MVSSARLHPPYIARPDPCLVSLSVSSYKVEQFRIRYGGRDFHFVSYEGQPANERRGEPAVPPMWYLMRSGRRWPVIPQVIGQPIVEIERALMAWLRDQGLGRAADAAP